MSGVGGEAVENVGLCAADVNEIDLCDELCVRVEERERD